MPASAPSHRPSPGRKAPRWLALLGLALAGGGLAYGLGWRLPGPDRHPAWPEFPQLTNPRLVVAEVPDFARRYGHRYRLPRLASYPVLDDFTETYRTNLHHLRAAGFQATGNVLVPGRRWLVWGSGNSTGQAGAPRRAHFAPTGYAYLALTLGGRTGYCKVPADAGVPALADFYEYNCIINIEDTLFIRYRGADYRVQVR